MRKKQEQFYKIYHSKGRTNDAAEFALGKVYSIKTWSKTKKQEQLDKLLCNDDGKLYLDSLDKTKKFRKNSEKTNENLDKSLEKTTSNEVGKKKLAKKKRGFASGYDSKADKTAREIFALGGSAADVQVALEISERTYYRWRIDNPSFYAAIMAGKDFRAVEEVEDSLVKRAKGFEVPYHEIEYDVGSNGEPIEIGRKRKVKIFAPDTNAAKAVLFNRSPERWSDRPESKLGNNDNDEDRKKLEEQSGEQRGTAERLIEELNSGILTEE